MSRGLSIVIDLVLIQLLTLALVTYCFRGATSICDGFMHLSNVKILLNSLNENGYFPRWNPYWYFGVPMFRLYSPLGYYMVAGLGWFFKLSLLEIVMLWSYLVFSISALSTYLLAQEMGLQRYGRLASSILFVTSANLIVYWGIGSYANVTGVAFSPLAIYFYLRAIRKRDILSIVAAGVAVGVVLLVYFINALVLSIFIFIMSAVAVALDPSLLLIPRGNNLPPKYTLIMPRILLLALVSATSISLWWVLPFLATFVTAGPVPGFGGDWGAVPTTTVSLEEHLMGVIGLTIDLNSPGLGHMILAIIGSFIIFKYKRRSPSIYFPACFGMALVFNFAPWLRIPMEPVPWWRTQLYLSLFASLCGGAVFDSIQSLYGKNTHVLVNSGDGVVHSIQSLIIVSLLLAVSTYPVMGTANVVFRGEDLQILQNILLLESRSKLGERIAMDNATSEYAFNMHSKLFQSSGGGVQYVYLANEFAYTFWRYLIYDKDSKFLSYFARNYNVRWFDLSSGAGMSGLNSAGPDLPYEVAEFNSSFVETLGPESIRVLFVGDSNEYSSIFISAALINPQDVVLVYGGKSLDGYGVAELGNFDVIYLHGLRYGSLENLNAMVSLLSAYVGDGGGLVLDTGDLTYGRELDNIPDPFPVAKTSVYAESYLLLKASNHLVSSNIDFEDFETNQSQSVSYAVTVKPDAVPLVYDEQRPVLAYRKYGSGKVVWTGVRLPYQIMLSKNQEEARFLLNIIRFASRMEASKAKGSATAKYPNHETVVVDVKDASGEEAVWLKMAYFPGWTAQTTGTDAKPLRIFQAGPSMMMVFPERSGDYSVKFYFEKTLDVVIGEWVSLLSVVAILVFTIYHALVLVRRKAPIGWTKTDHKGYDFNGLKQIAPNPSADLGNRNAIKIQRSSRETKDTAKAQLKRQEGPLDEASAIW